MRFARWIQAFAGMTNPKLTTTSRKSQAGFGIRAKPRSVAGCVTPIGAPN
jgi:hypothetical protein